MHAKCYFIHYLARYRHIVQDMVCQKPTIDYHYYHRCEKLNVFSYRLIYVVCIWSNRNSTKTIFVAGSRSNLYLELVARHPRGLLDLKLWLCFFRPRLQSVCIYSSVIVSTVRATLPDLNMIDTWGQPCLHYHIFHLYYWKPHMLQWTYHLICKETFPGDKRLLLPLV